MNVIFSGFTGERDAHVAPGNTSECAPEVLTVEVQHILRRSPAVPPTIITGTSPSILHTSLHYTLTTKLNWSHNLDKSLELQQGRDIK